MSATQDPEAERALLGACLISPTAIDDALPIVDAADFHTPRHQAIYDAIVTLHAAGQRVDPIELAHVIRIVDVPLEYLHELQNDTYSVSLARRYSSHVAEASVRRRLVHAGAEIVALGQGHAGALDIGDATDRARQLVADIDMPATIGQPDFTADEWIAMTDTSYDWMFEDFLEHGDRLLLTASEGAGKSVLLTQIAQMGAAGVHPWTRRRCPPVNVGLIDLENGDKRITRRLVQMRRHVPADYDPNRLRVASRPRGLNLTNAVDRRWLADRVAANCTQLLIIGPAYRLEGSSRRSDMGGEDKARQVTEVLDDLRDRFGLTILMETHAPHAGPSGRDLRPIGSSLWLRWPEFGIGLRRDKDRDGLFHIVHFRGPRDDRVWPESIARNGVTWPWTPKMATGAYQPPIDLYDDDHTLGGPAA